MALDEQRGDVGESRGDRIGSQQRLEEPALRQSAGELRWREQDQQQEDAGADTGLVGVRRGTDQQADRAEADGQQGPDAEAERQRRSQNPHITTEHPQVGDADEKCGEPQRQCGDEFADDDRSSRNGRDQQRLQAFRARVPH